MGRRALVAWIALLWMACGGGGGDTSSDQTAQGAAKLWMQAAMAGNTARVRELSGADFMERADKMAGEIKERFEPGSEFAWGGSGKEGEDYAWTATGPGGIVFLKVRQIGPGYRIVDVSNSW